MRPSATASNVDCNFVIVVGIIAVVVCVSLLGYEVALLKARKSTSRPAVALAECVTVSLVLVLVLAAAALSQSDFTQLCDRFKNGEHNVRGTHFDDCEQAIAWYSTSALYQNEGTTGLYRNLTNVQNASWGAVVMCVEPAT